jgi:hypothetical protein
VETDNGIFLFQRLSHTEARLKDKLLGVLYKVKKKERSVHLEVVSVHLFVRLSVTKFQS